MSVASPEAKVDATASVFVDGRWEDGGGELREIRSPYDGTLVGRLNDASAADVERAAVAAENAMRDPIAPYDRYRMLLRAAELLEERTEQFAHIISSEGGKPIRDSRVEVLRSEHTVRWCAEEARRLTGEVVPIGAVPGYEHCIGFTLRHPIGPVGAITPFNGAILALAHKVTTALAAGCPVVVKPSESTPLSAIRFVEVLVDAGVPAGHVNLVSGGREVGEEVVRNQRFAALSFTGSVAAGRKIQAEAGLRRTILELGNNSPVVVCDDADLELAASGAARGAYGYAGQQCISLQRALVHRSVYDRFLELLAPKVAALRVGDPMDESTEIGPMITEEAAIRAESAIQEAVAAGARVLVGGGRSGSTVEPTVLVDVDAEMRLVCHEAFAPVLSVMPFDELDEAIEMANGTPYGLMSSVFTENVNTAFRLGTSLRTGTIVVNDAPFRVDHAPFAGLKDSGIGREGVRYSIDTFTEERLMSIAVSR